LANTDIISDRFSVEELGDAGEKKNLGYVP